MLRLFCLSIFSLWVFMSYGQSWKQCKIKKEAQLDIHWYHSEPFIYKNDEGQLEGFEVEIMEMFSKYVKQSYNIDIRLNWIEGENFDSIVEELDGNNKSNQFGVASLSITDKRLEVVDFSDPYLINIIALVNSPEIPIAKDKKELASFLEKSEAVTMKGTLLESSLKKLKKELDIDFKINYIQRGTSELNYLVKGSGYFAYVDLPLYLMHMKNGGEISRQNLFVSKGRGYGFAVSKESDWVIPLNEYLSDPFNRLEIDYLISKYLGAELFRFFESIYQEDVLNTSLLVKEKELQLSFIKDANEALEKGKAYNRMMWIGITVAILLILVILKLYLDNRNTTRQLIDQKNKIQDQQLDIKVKNEQLISRNTKLMELNEEKNNLIKIVAHDLRAPLKQIIGIADILEASSSEDLKERISLLPEISKSANRLSEMIAKILDVKTLDEGGNSVIKEKVKIAYILDDLTNWYKPLADRKGIQFLTKKDGDQDFVNTDVLLIILILENLVSNAIKFSPQGTVVKLECDASLKEVLFRIVDQGPGFTRKDKMLMFNRFQRLSAKPTGNESSTGLGLSIVKKYVADLGGKVWLDSDPGEGSTFYISLPAG